MVPCHSSKRMIHTKINHSLFNLWGCLHVATFHCQVWIINCKNLPLTLMLLHIPLRHCTLVPQKIAFCLFEEIKGPRYLHSAFKCEKPTCISSHYTWPLRKLSCPTWVSCRNGRSAVPMVEWAQRWSARQAGRGAFHFGPAKNDLTELVCLEDFVKKTTVRITFLFGAWHRFFIRVSSLAGCVLSCIAYFSKAVGNISSQKRPKVTYPYHICASVIRWHLWSKE